ncbi:MAG: hypothetical protein VSS75_014070 [Candidatus Parabeggiatoa sp.]|nr:hypothetical protein [Candidatus Parabeggiatoa sp.]
MTSLNKVLYSEIRFSPRPTGDEAWVSQTEHWSGTTRMTATYSPFKTLERAIKGTLAGMGKKEAEIVERVSEHHVIVKLS